MEYFIQISNFTLVINPQNGKNFMLDGIVNELSQSTKSKLISNGFYDSLDSVFPDTEKMNIVNPTICITSHCNLSCKYCFRKDFSFKLETISFDKCIDFIKFMQNYYPSYEYMRLDLTGYGEPLIAIDQIKKIVSISKSLSEPKKVIDVGFATNGTLLNVEITDYLKQNQIYYGISIDGLKKENDSNRRGKNIKSVFELVNSNLSYVDKSFIGVSSTLTYKTKNLVKNYDYFVKRFATITMKPVREGLDTSGVTSNKYVRKLISEFSELSSVLLEHALKSDLDYVYPIIQDEDFLGKFIKRALINIPVMARCGAATSKIAMDTDGKLYICGAAVGIDSFLIGTLESGVNTELKDSIIKRLLDRSTCCNCWAKFICGGPCLVQIYDISADLNTLDDNFCHLIREVIKIAFNFKYVLLKKNPSAFYDLRSVCLDTYYK